MRIIVDQRYIKKQDGKMWLQFKYIEGTYMDAGGALGVSQATVSEWEDVPVCLDEWGK